MGLGRVAYAANKIGEARVRTETLEFRPAPHVKEGGGLRLVGLFQPSQSVVFFVRSNIQVIEASVPADLEVFVFSFYLFPALRGSYRISPLPCTIGGISTMVHVYVFC